MKMAVLILGIIGAITSGILGSNWLSDYGQLTEQQKAMAQLAGNGDKLMDMGTAGLMLILGFFAGLVAVFMAWKDKFLYAGGLMLAGGILPIFFASQAIVFTIPLIAGGALALVLHRKSTTSA